MAEEILTIHIPLNKDVAERFVAAEAAHAYDDPLCNQIWALVCRAYDEEIKLVGHKFAVINGPEFKEMSTNGPMKFDGDDTVYLVFEGKALS